MGNQVTRQNPGLNARQGGSRTGGFPPVSTPPVSLAAFEAEKPPRVTV